MPMQIVMKPEYSEEHSRCFADVEIVRNDGVVVFVCNQQTDGISIKTVTHEFFAEIDAQEFQEEMRQYFGSGAEFSYEEFDIVIGGSCITDDRRNRFLIHIVDVCGFRLGECGPVRDFQIKRGA
jgi:hypothetical protein